MRPIIPRIELTPIASVPALYNPRDLALIRRTVASDTTDDEFALFIHWARSLRLDPLRRQVHAFVFHKHDPKKRRLSLVTSIEGFRAIAARTGNYCPASLSTIARDITGTVWNGPRFFGLRAGGNRLKDIERDPAGSQARTPDADCLSRQDGRVSTLPAKAQR